MEGVLKGLWGTWFAGFQVAMGDQFQDGAIGGENVEEDHEEDVVILGGNVGHGDEDIEMMLLVRGVRFGQVPMEREGSSSSTGLVLPGEANCSVLEGGRVIAERWFLGCMPTADSIHLERRGLSRVAEELAVAAAQAAVLTSHVVGRLQDADVAVFVERVQFHQQKELEREAAREKERLEEQIQFLEEENNILRADVGVLEREIGYARGSYRRGYADALREVARRHPGIDLGGLGATASLAGLGRTPRPFVWEISVGGSNLPSSSRSALRSTRGLCMPSPGPRPSGDGGGSGGMGLHSPD